MKQWIKQSYYNSHCFHVQFIFFFKCWSSTGPGKLRLHVDVFNAFLKCYLFRWVSRSTWRRPHFTRPFMDVLETGPHGLCSDGALIYLFNRGMHAKTWHSLCLCSVQVYFIKNTLKVTGGISVYIYEIFLLGSCRISILDFKDTPVFTISLYSAKLLFAIVVLKPLLYKHKIKMVYINVHHTYVKWVKMFPVWLYQVIPKIWIDPCYRRSGYSTAHLTFLHYKVEIQYSFIDVNTLYINTLHAYEGPPKVVSE